MRSFEHPRALQQQQATPSITIGGSTTIDFDVDEGQITINGEGLNGRSFQRNESTG